MKGRQHPTNDVALNTSGNESIRDVIARVDERRRIFLKGTLSASVLAAMGGVGLGALPRAAQAAIPASVGFAGIGFASVPPNLATSAAGILEKDLVSVPPGYSAQVFLAWGDPIMPTAPDWDVAATQDAAAQEKQVGMHHDGMHFFPFPTRGNGRLGVSGQRGLLCVNHEYTDENQLHGSEGLTGGAGVTIAKVRKSQAAHGVSVSEVFKAGNKWQVQRGSPFGRRITANTKMALSGPAAGNDALKARAYDITPAGSVYTGTQADGRTVYGTLNNCANGYTSWGTYLTCEENWNGYFGTTAAGFSATPEERRYGLSAAGAGYRWHQVDERFDLRANPKEPNLFGWVVEIDPFDPNSVPVKRTALGRFKHESAQEVIDKDNAVGIYMGDDERNEYIYKFVCERPFTPDNRVANRDLLDSGTLYVARFKADGTGEWLPLVWSPVGPLSPANGFNSQADVLIKTRQAADRLGATMMDRPEWTAARPRTLGWNKVEVYCTLTNNSRRGNTPASANSAAGTTTAASANPAVDAANPRPDNDYGHIIRWREDGDSVRATTFTWDLFVQCGDKLNDQVAFGFGPKLIGASYNKANLAGVDPALPNAGYSREIYKGDIVGDDYGAPDGLWFDAYGRLWIQTDQQGDGQGDWRNIGGNMMLCADPNTRETRRFLTAPTDCEVTGITMTPDHRTMFINIQHPGDRGTPDNPTASSNWPHSQGYGPSGRPRSATVVITKDDGGIIGT